MWTWKLAWTVDWCCGRNAPSLYFPASTWTRRAQDLTKACERIGTEISFLQRQDRKRKQQSDPNQDVSDETESPIRKSRMMLCGWAFRRRDSFAFCFCCAVPVVAMRIPPFLPLVVLVNFLLWGFLIAPWLHFITLARRAPRRASRQWPGQAMTLRLKQFACCLPI